MVPYQKHQDKDQSGGTSTGGPVYYNTITAMPQYQGKSVEELRWEDYQAGIKNASSAPPPSPGAFGAPASSAAFGGFGATPTPGFGAAQPAANPFGAPAASSPFGGGFGAASSEHAR
jgi:nuclear pore complex protein Nup98-Nup96